MGFFSWGSGKAEPPPTSSSSGRMAPQSQAAIKALLTRAWHDKQLHASIARRIQGRVPSLGPELAMKACLGTIAKLVSTIPAGWARAAWEKNICDMLHNSPPMKFEAGEELAICRLVENDLCRFFGWPIEIPDLPAPKNDAIYINATTGGIRWLISRGEDKLVIIGAMLTSLLLTSMERGWSAKGLQSAANSSGKTELTLSPCAISEYEARSLARAITELHATAGSEKTPVFQQVGILVAFLEGGEFRIDRAPNDVTQPKSGSELIWRLRKPATPALALVDVEPIPKSANIPVGFAGLDSMVSDVDADIKKLPTSPAPAASAPNQSPSVDLSWLFDAPNIDLDLARNLLQRLKKRYTQLDGEQSLIASAIEAGVPEDTAVAIVKAFNIVGNEGIIEVAEGSMTGQYDVQQIDWSQKSAGYSHDQALGAIKELRALIATTTDPATRAGFRRRIAEIADGIAVIKVGYSSRPDLQTKMRLLPTYIEITREIINRHA
jgi:hypothetical protein